jgi:phosphoribosylanthranilate isomerase
VDKFSKAKGILLDTYHPDIPGGTGETFDWKKIPRNIGKHLILAGGLTSENVWQVISTVKPYAVDVSSGVELEKGIKDADKIAAFMRGVMSV